MKNPFRNKTRTTLSIIGIAIGIITIVALGLITGGLEESIQTSLNSGGAEITVSGAVDNNTGSSINVEESYVNKLKNIPGVNDTAGIISITDTSSSGSTSVSDSSPANRDSSLVSRSSFHAGGSSRGGLTINGIESSKLNLIGISDINGSIYADGSNDVIIGKSLAETQRKSIGDTITVSGHKFTITGIYETGSMMTDNYIYGSYSTIKDLGDRTYVNQILVKTNEGANDTQISDNIEETYPDLSTITSTEQMKMISTITSVLDLVSLAISLLAIIVGGIGIINTMVMTVYERTKEIGVLRAVGWKSRRILVMILGETLVLTMISAIVGIICGIGICEIGIRLLGSADTMFSLAYTPDTFILAFSVAIIVGILGGIYPAYRASKLEPTEALRYE